jgi:hypothetical protein
MFETSVDIAALNAALGAYAQHEGIYQVKQVFNDLESFRHIMVYDKVKDEVPMITPKIGNVVQKGETGRFNPPQNFVFEVQKLKVRPWKVDYALVPLDLHRSYLALRQAPGSQFDQSWLFETFLTNMVLQAVKQDIEAAVWRGEYVTTPASDGVANPLSVCTGFLKLFEDNIAECNVATTGAITLSNAVDAFEAVFAEVPSALHRDGMKLFCSIPAWNKYKLNYRERFGALPYNDKYEKVFLDVAGENLEIIPVREMGNSNRIIIDAINTMAIGHDLGYDIQRLMTNADITTRAVNMIMDGKIGVGVSAWRSDETTKLITLNDAA